MANMRNNPTLNPKRLSDDGLTPERSFLPFIVALSIVVITMVSVFSLRAYNKNHKDIYAGQYVMESIGESIGYFNDGNYPKLKTIFTEKVVSKTITSDQLFKAYREDNWAGKDGLRLKSVDTPQVNREKNTARVELVLQSLDKDIKETKNYKVDLIMVDEKWMIDSLFFLDQPISFDVGWTFYTPLDKVNSNKIS